MRCSRCRTADRLQGQRWCRSCLTAYQRERRTKTMSRSAAPVPSLPELAAPAVGAIPAELRKRMPTELTTEYQIYLARIINGW